MKFLELQIKLSKSLQRPNDISYFDPYQVELTTQQSHLAYSLTLIQICLSHCQNGFMDQVLLAQDIKEFPFHAYF